MPYISPERRPNIDEAVLPLASLLREMGTVKGDLNYAICRLILKVYRIDVKPGYTVCSTALSVLIDVEAELRRRIMNPYEDIKKEENGDIF